MKTPSGAHGTTERDIETQVQADMFDPTVSGPAYADYFAFTPIVRALVEESQNFHGPVYLFNGDSHVYNSDHPLAPGSPWLAFYGVPSPATNLTRITVDGSDNAKNYLRVTVSPRSAAGLSWERVPFSTP